jgi:adenylate cyclase
MGAELNILLPHQTSRRFPLGAMCTIGRDPGNDLVLDNVRVSRNHALIRLLGGNRYNLMDLGSANGTFLNGRLVSVPVELNPGDQIIVADCTLTFVPHEPPGAGPFSQHTVDVTTRTATDVLQETISILVMDVRDYTRLAESLPGVELSQFMGGWFREVGVFVDRHGGTIDKFIGDAVMAYWPRARARDDRRFAHGPLAAAVESVRLAQTFDDRLRAGHAGLRFAVGCGIHLGEVLFANVGQSARRDFTAMGDCVNVAFRIESLCKPLGRPILASREVKEIAGDAFRFEDLGRQPVKGRSEEVHVFAVSRT